MREKIVIAALLAVASGMAAAPANAGELGPDEVFIDPLGSSGGLMSSLVPMSPRPQTELHLVPLEFMIMDVNIPGGLWFASIQREKMYQYQLRVGGKIAFFKRFELGADLMPLHVTYASVSTRPGGGDWETYEDTDANFGNFALHFMGNILSRHGALPLYLSAALRVTFPTGGDVILDLDGDRDPGNEEIQAKLDSWIVEPQLLFGVTIANMVTLSTRQGLAMVLVGDGRQYPFLGSDQIHWYMNFAVGVAPIRKWFSVLLDFTGMFSMNEVDYTTLERTWDRAHIKYLTLGVGAKVYPLDPLSIEIGARFGLNDETRQSAGAYVITLAASWEFDFGIGGITVIKETKAGAPAKTVEGGDDEG